jgi:hypothetical protein
VEAANRATASPVSEGADTRNRRQDSHRCQLSHSANPPPQGAASTELRAPEAESLSPLDSAGAEQVPLPSLADAVQNRLKNELTARVVQPIGGC